ncbi:MAG: hypothetical protein A2297_02360 [Elusimicrobia bacterium RIFOXYB2_FULL_48_7]|nr:MAG: hypothetical protein A2297_02360 [Elusimicrobia bacterium RIFOXYB2_FULL_48_7]
MRKKILVLSVILSAFLVFAAMVANTQKTGNDLCAVIMKVEGTVQFQPENTAKWLKAKAGLGLKKGDSIKTSENSQTTVILEGGTIFKIAQNSLIKLEQISVDLSKKTSEIHLALSEKGSIISHVNKMRSTMMNVRTPVATVSIRGTGLAVDVLDENTADVAVFEGKVVVKDFVREAGLPADHNELMLDFLHEISVKPDQVTTVTKKGIGKPRKIQGDMLAKKEEFKKLKSASDETRKTWAKSTYEQRNTDRSKTRDEVIEKGE